jgi:hypothetical protein
MSTEQQARKIARADLVTRLFILVVLVSVVSGVALMTVLSVQSAHRGRENHQLLQTVQSCTTPGQPCFHEAQKRTAGAVASINRVVILAAACAVGRTGTVAEIQTAIQACVIDRLAADQSKGESP